MLSEKTISSISDSGLRENTTSLYPFVSVIMPVRNEAAFIERSIGAVAAQDYPPDLMEILIADGMSEDATREIIRSLQQRLPNLKLIDNPGKIVATGLNAALCHTRGEIIVRIDGHCEVAPDYLRRCVSHLVDTPVDAVGGPVETVGESFTAWVIAAAMSSRFGVGGSAFRVTKGNKQFVDTVAFPAYTRSVIERAGPFDEELVRNQDDEYNYRLRKLGVKILLAPDIRSRYYSRATLTKLASQYFQYGYWKVRVMQKHPRQMQLRQFVPPLFVAALLAGLLMTAVWSTAAYMTGLVIALYAFAVIAASILSAKKSKWQLLPLLPIAFAILHLAYGLGFLIGFVRFWNRWGEGQSQSQARVPVTDVGKV